MITKQFAEEFSKDWLDAWNCHDMERILAHYSDDFVMSSPKIAAIANEASGVLYGKAKIAEYWSKALSLIPNLRFQLIHTFVGADSIIIYYQGVSGLATEVFFFDAEGLVIKAAAHYE
jgi:ketosteroid isomerase-like protein